MLQYPFCKFNFYSRLTYPFACLALLVVCVAFAVWEVSKNGGFPSTVQYYCRFGGLIVVSVAFSLFKIVESGSVVVDNSKRSIFARCFKLFGFIHSLAIAIATACESELITVAPNNSQMVHIQYRVEHLNLLTIATF